MATNGFNIGPIRDESLSAIIVLSVLGITAALSLALVLLAWYAIGRTDISIQRTQDIVLVIVPVITLTIGSAYGILVGRSLSLKGARSGG